MQLCIHRRNCLLIFLVKSSELQLPRTISSIGFLLCHQMGFFKQYGKTVATYESCSTAAYKHGRTETVRSATTATKKACELFASSQSSVEAMRKSMEECSTIHSQLIKEAAMGKWCFIAELI